MPTAEMPTAELRLAPLPTLARNLRADRRQDVAPHVALLVGDDR